MAGSLWNNWMIEHFGNSANNLQVEAQAVFPSVGFAMQILLHQAFLFKYPGMIMLT